MSTSNTVASLKVSMNNLLVQCMTYKNMPCVRGFNIGSSLIVQIFHITWEINICKTIKYIIHAIFTKNLNQQTNIQIFTRKIHIIIFFELPDCMSKGIYHTTRAIVLQLYHRITGISYMFTSIYNVCSEL